MHVSAQEDTMKNWEHRIREDSFLEFVQELVEWNEIDGAALGIAKQVVAQGIGSLSDKQLWVFKTYVLDAQTVDRCERCAHEIPWHEMARARRNGGYCDYCEHMQNRARD
jgi:hypothetical protein